MKFARIVERANRQILLTTSRDPDSSGYIVTIETHYAGEKFVTVDLTGFKSYQVAYDAMMRITDDDVMLAFTEVIDNLDEQ